MGPHGPHVTLTNLTPAPAPGSTVTLELHFAHATPATTVVAVGRILRIASRIGPLPADTPCSEGDVGHR